MDVSIEWNEAKATANIAKHGVSFEEAATVIVSRLSMTIPDQDHSIGEERFLTYGISRYARYLAVAHTDRGESLRIISARPMTKHERKSYEEGTL